MRLNDSPHLLMLTQAQWDAERVGHWRFRVEPVAGGRTFEAVGEEAGCSRDRLELLAVLRGLESLDEPSQITLITASNYVSRGFRFGLSDWRERDWCWESYGRWTEIRDADLWRRVDSAMHYHSVKCRFWEMPQWAERSIASPPGLSADRVTGIWTGLWRRLRRFAALPENTRDSVSLATS